MSRIIKPSDIKKFIDPDQQRVYKFTSDTNPKYYLSRAINYLTRLIGNDVVLTGLNSTATVSDNSVIFSVGSGKLIQDSTLIEINSNDEIILENANIFDSNGKFVIYVDYIYLETSKENSVKIGVDHISNSGVSANPWYPNRFRIILNIFEFVKDSNDNILSVNESDQTTILVNGVVYYKFGLRHDLGGFLEHIVKFEAGTSSGGNNNGDDGTQFFEISTNFQASNKNIIFVQPTSNIEITAPQNPKIGDWFIIIDHTGLFATYRVIVRRNTSKIMSIDDDIELNKQYCSVIFRYINSTHGWFVGLE